MPKIVEAIYDGGILHPLSPIKGLKNIRELL